MWSDFVHNAHLYLPTIQENKYLLDFPEIKIKYKAWNVEECWKLYLPDSDDQIQAHTCHKACNAC